MIEDMAIHIKCTSSTGSLLEGILGNHFVFHQCPDPHYLPNEYSSASLTPTAPSIPLLCFGLQKSYAEHPGSGPKPILSCSHMLHVCMIHAHLL